MVPFWYKLCYPKNGIFSTYSELLTCCSFWTKNPNKLESFYFELRTTVYLIEFNRRVKASCWGVDNVIARIHSFAIIQCLHHLPSIVSNEKCSSYSLFLTYARIFLVCANNTSRSMKTVKMHNDSFVDIKNNYLFAIVYWRIVVIKGIVTWWADERIISLLHCSAVFLYLNKSL